MKYKKILLQRISFDFMKNFILIWTKLWNSLVSGTYELPLVDEFHSQSFGLYMEDWNLKDQSLKRPNILNFHRNAEGRTLFHK